jgi:integrase/recombinase XerD
MASYQYKREPLYPDEAHRLANACESHEERLVVWTLLDTGLRVSELAGLTRKDLDSQNHRISVRGNGGPYGSRSKRRISPLPSRASPPRGTPLASRQTFGMTSRTIQRIVKRLSSRPAISRPMTPYVLRHTFSVTAIQKNKIYVNLSPEAVVGEGFL